MNSVSGYARIAGTVEQGTLASLYARTLVIGIYMRNEAINSIVFSILSGQLSEQEVQHAYDRYNYATRYLGLVTATTENVFTGFQYMQAAIGFAQGLTTLPIASYSSIPFAYQSKVNGLNQHVVIGLEKIVKDPVKFEHVKESLKDMSNLIVQLGQKIVG